MTTHNTVTVTYYVNEKLFLNTPKKNESVYQGHSFVIQRAACTNKIFPCCNNLLPVYEIELSTGYVSTAEGIQGG